jgi:KipI family sensor histidine kinase inhibitor
MGLYPETQFLLMGDRGLLLEFGDEISAEVNEKVRRMALALQAEKPEGIIEVVPTYRSLLVLYNPLTIPLEDLKRRLKQLEASLKKISFPDPKLTRIPVLYGGTFGPDLGKVGEYLRLAEEEVVRLHCSKPYFIYMIGFMPGFPYMGELPETLVTPRLKTPRLIVPAGSVAIAQRQTGIYSMESPGGWQILGRTPVRIFNPEKESPALLRMGDLVQFYPINEREFDEWNSESASSYADCSASEDRWHRA